MQKLQKRKVEILLYGLLSVSLFPIALIGLYFFLENDKRDCPYCGEKIKKNAVKCRFCHTTIEPIKDENNIKSKTLQKEFDSQNNSFTEAYKQWRKENGYNN